jgi:glycosyltransferase involved in cell wall biosynthesis
MKIAVAIPFYNEESTILNTLDSFNSHPYFSQNCCFSLVNNNSTDNSVKLIKEYQKKKNRVKIILHNEKKHGIKYARKRSLDEALKLKPEIILGTDADTIFNKKSLEEIYTFVNSKKFNVFAGKTSIKPEKKLLNLIYLGSFHNLINYLWQYEFDIFGSYFFGAFFALKTVFYQKIQKYYNPKQSIAIYQNSGEDILLSRRCYNMNGRFYYAKNKALTSSRRSFNNPINYVTGARNKYYRQSKKSYNKKLIKFINQNQKKLIQKRITHTVNRWSRYFIDELLFWNQTNKKYKKSLQTLQNFTQFFQIPINEINTKVNTKNQKLVLSKLFKKYKQRCINTLVKKIQANKKIKIDKL